jgi:hypothetical protein
MQKLRGLYYLTTKGEVKQLQIYEKLKQKSAHWGGAQVTSEGKVGASDNLQAANDTEMMPGQRRNISKDDSYLMDRIPGGSSRQSPNYVGEDVIELNMVEEEIANIIDR